MFWGLIVEPHKRYSQVVKRAFHVSMACLDVTNSKLEDTPIQVILCYDNRKYILCNLIKDKMPQVPLNLTFDIGSKITLITNGNSNVHLTGYHILEDDDGYSDEEGDKETPKKRKNSTENERPGKKSKLEIKNDKSGNKNDKSVDKNDKSVEDEEDDDSEDEDFSEKEAEDLSDMDDEEEEEEEADEEEDEDSEDSEESEIEEPVSTKQKKQKPLKDKKKKDNQKNMNGFASESEKGSSLRTLDGGVQIDDIKLGTGTPVKKGSVVYVYYIGRLNNGKKFDSVTSGKGLKFKIGRGEVIKGWDLGVAGMKVGGKRRVIIPPAYAYGPKGYPPIIPGNSKLTFDIELKSVV